MNKEQLNKILPYCGHGLKSIRMRDGKIFTVDLSGVNSNRCSLINMLLTNQIGKYHSYPILFHHSCITQEIETEYGKEIPLIEIAKLAFPGTYYNWMIKNNRAESGALSVRMDWNSGILIDRIISSDGYFCPEKIHNQWQLFQYLYSRHIAFNLDPGEYVSVESLEKNPYTE